MKCNVLVAAFAVLTAMAPDAFPATPTGELLGIVTDTGNWTADCNAAKCLIIHEELHGGNRRIVTEIVGTDHKVGSFSLVVDGDIDENEGFVVVFMRTQVDTSRAECKANTNGMRPPRCYSVTQLGDATFNGPFISCREGSCFAKVQGQYAGDSRNKRRVDLLEQFENDDLMLILFKDKKGNLKRDALDISGFNEAYQAALRALK